MPNPLKQSPPPVGPPRPGTTVPRALEELAEAVPAARITGPADAAKALVTGFTHDSRAVRPGDLYAAMPGAAVHGAQFAPQAAQAGAAAILADESGAERAAATGLPVLLVPEVRPALGPIAARVYGEPASALLMLGVTGTNGKTTTTYLIDGGLRAAGLRTGLIGTVETRIADRVVKSVRTTPEAPDLQALLAVMREDGVGAVAMEVSSHALAYGRTAGIRYRVAAFTNLTQDHLDFHADFEDYFETKAKLFTPEYTGFAVLNADDAHGRRLIERVAAIGLPHWTFSAEGAPGADWRALDVRLGPDGTRFTLVGPDGARREAEVALPGEFNVENAVAAVACLVAAGIDPDTAIAGVASVPGVPGRMQRVDAGQPYLAVVDYAHTPDAIETLLSAVRPVTSGTLRIVVGCGGDRDRGKRPLMGAAAARGADEVILTNDNPRSEDPLVILDAAAAGAREAVAAGAHATVAVVPDRSEAIALAVSASRRGDAVVVAGKGHEQGQEIGGVVYPFDDAAVLREAIWACAPSGSWGTVSETGTVSEKGTVSRTGADSESGSASGSGSAAP
ncbi:MAG TPA: UDP-N-acetylmuramoyl-L-alanyl-D-glutamate--2,6-diaminopimelate ligase [Actinocrinis sp.]|uniref:UDP-N-acetylmuramoyl-L-alanyl-D-glutamate--2, 6-diaminopimelate ligase n=1 Tax=Actinocrinis sp. TaxID=1920516 RepID=UPI002DDC9D8F|nr:UDP-N-acetylmuramoyl-L-alanyl-D-glutamate--2,6-diaminopimelate ligase [Actinocrinis sp.]HEV3169921.1 UDP-N-acetylmuramoyl-L-alanyl-D-glutamate--2,6-diaminopimelate ligase [Actinocrinis sp.]